MTHNRTLLVWDGCDARHYAVALARLLPEYHFDMLCPNSDEEYGLPNNIRRIGDMDDVIYKIYEYSHLINIGDQANKSSLALSLVFGKLKKTRLDLQYELLQESYIGKKLTADLLADKIVSWEEFGLLSLQPPRRALPGKTIGVITDFSGGRVDPELADRFRRCIVELALALPTHRILWRPNSSEFAEADGREPAFKYPGLARDNLAILDYSQVQCRSIDEFLADVDILIATPSRALVSASSSGCPALAFGDPALAAKLVNVAEGGWVSNAQETIEAARQFYAGNPVRSLRWKFPQEFDQKAIEAIIGSPQEAVRPLSREDEILTALEIAHWVHGHGRN